MRYELSISKIPQSVMNQTTKLIEVLWSPRYDAAVFAALNELVQESLGEKFVGFEVTDMPDSHALGIEYVDQPTPEDTAAVNGLIDQALFATVM